MAANQLTLALEAEHPSKELQFRFGYVCLLELQDYVFYASRDHGALVVTVTEIISNYSIGYALGAACTRNDNQLACFPISQPQLKDQTTYQSDFRDLPFYITPARPLRHVRGHDEVRAFGIKSAFVQTKARNYNTIPERFKERFSKDYSKLFPMFGRYVMIAPESRFVFTVFSECKLTFPRYIRLGKFKAPVSVQVKGEGTPILRGNEGQEFDSEPLHYDDLLPQLPIVVYDLVRLGKAHAALTNLRARGRFWELTVKDLSYRLPAGVGFCRRSILR